MTYTREPNGSSAGSKTPAVTQASALLSSELFRSAKEQLLRAIASGCAPLRCIRAPTGSADAREQYAKTLQDFYRDRGRELYFPFLSSGMGSGPFVELLDGSVKYDMITGIGINFFGHCHPELMAEAINAVPSDIMQGNLQPGHEAASLLKTVLARVGSGSRLSHGWLMCSGTMVNEVALKVIRQKRAPATKILAFRDCFAGRSTAMQEITDNPKYREGQPVYGEAYYLSFYDPKAGLEASAQATLREMREHLARFPGKFAALMMEPVQGEGGFLSAPRDFYVRVFEEARKAGLAIWLDEIQTFGRTGELFAFQKLGLNEYVDVVTAGKMLQACMVLFSGEYNPKPGLVAGTFSGSSVALRTARRTIELLCDEGYLGKDGKIEKLSARFVAGLEKLRAGAPAGAIGEIRAFGGMIGFVPFGGTLDDCKTVLMRLFDLGVVAFYCGHGPHLIRMLPPLGALAEADIDEVCNLVGRALDEAAKARVKA